MGRRRVVAMSGLMGADSLSAGMAGAKIGAHYRLRWRSEHKGWRPGLALTAEFAGQYLTGAVMQCRYGPSSKWDTCSVRAPTTLYTRIERVE